MKGRYCEFLTQIYLTTKKDTDLLILKLYKKLKLVKETTLSLQ